MNEKQTPKPNCGCVGKTDRYVSFNGINCIGNARRVIDYIENNLGESEQYQRFWEYFTAKRKPRSGPPPDDLFLVHCHINQIRELFEESADEEALALLSQLEEECC